MICMTTKCPMETMEVDGRNNTNMYDKLWKLAKRCCWELFALRLWRWTEIVVIDDLLQQSYVSIDDWIHNYHVGKYNGACWLSWRWCIWQYSNEEVATCWYWSFSLWTKYNDGEVHESHMDLLEQTSQLFTTFLDSNEELKASNQIYSCKMNHR